MAQLCKGWTTGCSAALATKAAAPAFVDKCFPDEVSFALLNGGEPRFPLADAEMPVSGHGGDILTADGFA